MVYKTGTETLAEKWLVAAVKRNFLTKLSIELSMELRKLTTVDEVHNIVNIYRHDHRTGSPRGVPGIMIAMTEQTTDAEPANSSNAVTSNTTTTLGVVTTEDNHLCKNTNTATSNDGTTNTGQDINAASKGGKAKNGKGYGQCWECGEWGHPRRECPKFIARMAGKGGDVNALKGAGKKG